MQYTKFGSTGLRVSRLCLGTMTFGLQCDEAQSHAIMDTAAAGGIDFFDTADVYPLGGSRTTAGRTEQIVGNWLKGKRHDFILATKCVGVTGPKPWDQGMSRKHILDAIDASLRRLGTDYVDLYQLHGYDRNTPIDEALEALDTVVRAGKARYIGVSNWPAHKIARALGRSELKNIARIASVQPRYNMLFRSFERDLLPMCEDESIAVIPYNPLAGGLLTGKHNGKAPPPPRHPFRPRHRRQPLPRALLERKGIRNHRIPASDRCRGRQQHGHPGVVVGPVEPRHHRPDRRCQPSRTACRKPRRRRKAAAT